jgi:hypothetical protein
MDWRVKTEAPVIAPGPGSADQGKKQMCGTAERSCALPAQGTDAERSRTTGESIVLGKSIQKRLPLPGARITGTMQTFEDTEYSFVVLGRNADTVVFRPEPDARPGVFSGPRKNWQMGC